MTRLDSIVPMIFVKSVLRSIAFYEKVWLRGQQYLYAARTALTARYYPEDEEFLLELEPTVMHYEV